MVSKLINMVQEAMINKLWEIAQQNFSLFSMQTCSNLNDRDHNVCCAIFEVSFNIHIVIGIVTLQKMNK